MPSLLKELHAYGQAPWLDFIDRTYLQEGHLHQLVERDGVSGVTSNPSIFEKAIGKGDAYDEQISQIVADRPGASAIEIYEALAVRDIQHACDILHGVYAATQAADGYVSIEVSPTLADDTNGTIEEGRRLWTQVDRPNLMIKVPGTRAGVPAVRALIEAGINVNVTLLFDVDAYGAVAQAYIDGLEARHAAGESIASIASVASFFISRIDARIDKKIDERVTAGDTQSNDLLAIRGSVAMANAKAAYRTFSTIFDCARWSALAEKGGKVQRLLWASTGTKDPSFPDTTYVDGLIGPGTVNTMPLDTLNAFRDHGTADRTIDRNVARAVQILETAADLGLNLTGINAHLLEEGLDVFKKAHQDLLGAIEGKLGALRRSMTLSA
ncbi:transaldolase [Novosphingobium sp.]|uniref:transaldolase n=1 Tax=Novosphingobium sp. TaxID=1874826 RepID=UPI0028B16ABB|nr:transaldolase [Novosphingobium sp.]